MKREKKSTSDDKIIKVKKSKKKEQEEANNDVSDEVEYDQNDLKQIFTSAGDGAVQSVKQINPKKRQKKAFEAKTEDESETVNPALDYLLKWRDDRKAWKFKKVRQTWLLQNVYDKDQVSKSNFKVLLKYIDDLQGKARDVTFENAQKILDDESESDTRKVKRATKIAKILS